MKKLKLETERLILTEWGDSFGEEKEFLLMNFNNFNVVKSLFNPPYPYKEEDAENWINSRKQSMDKGNYCLKIVRKEDKKLLGNINLDTREYKVSAEVGYWICEEDWKKGYASEALEEMIRFGFKKLKLHKIYAKHYVDNPASGRVMQKCGMKYEGTQKEQILTHGVFHDLDFYGIINKLIGVNEMKTIFFYRIEGIDKEKLFCVYREGIRRNAERFKETEKQIEDAHWDYLTDFLENRHGILAVLVDDKKYYAAIRVLPKGENKFYCEAFEVAEKERGKGFGKQLYRDVIKYISTNNNNFEIEAHTWKTNEASIKSHLSVGFNVEKNYVIREDGTKDDFGVTLCLKK